MAKKVARKSRVSPDVSKFILNCLPSPQPERNWGLDAASAAGVYAAAAAIPASKDLRDATWWPAGNQGNTGSCVGWGTADSVLRWHFVKANRLAKTEPLSVRQVWMSAKETDVYTTRPTTFIEQGGTWLTAALDIARKYGVVTGSVLPFQNPPGTPALYLGAENAFFALAAQRKIASYFNLGRNLSQWRAWIANNGPILTRLDVDTTWYNATATYGHLATYDAAHTYGGHCVALVGYTQGYFIVRNSWGAGWGDKGFAYASNAYASVAFTEAYGVSL